MFRQFTQTTIITYEIHKVNCNYSKFNNYIYQRNLSKSTYVVTYKRTYIRSDKGTNIRSLKAQPPDQRLNNQLTTITLLADRKLVETKTTTTLASISDRRLVMTNEKNNYVCMYIYRTEK